MKYFVTDLEIPDPLAKKAVIEFIQTQSYMINQEMNLEEVEEVCAKYLIGK